jgi:hypothetical protein
MRRANTALPNLRPWASQTLRVGHCAKLCLGPLVAARAQGEFLEFLPISEVKSVKLRAGIDDHSLQPLDKLRRPE